MSLTVGRRMLATLIVLAMGLSVVPAGEAQLGGQGPFFVATAAQIAPPEGVMVPGQPYVMHGVVHSFCVLGYPGVAARQLTGVESYEISLNTTDPALVASVEPAKFMLEWNHAECVSGAEQRHTFHIHIAFQKDVPAFSRANLKVVVEHDWGQPNSLNVALAAGFRGAVAVDAPERIVLDPGVAQTVPFTVTNTANGPVYVDADPTLRLIDGPQPDIPVFQLATGESRVVHVPVRTDDEGGQGVLDIRFDAYSADDRSAAAHIDRVRVPVEVGGLSPSSDSVEEASLPSMLAFAAFLALALVGVARRP